MLLDYWAHKLAKMEKAAAEYAVRGGDMTYYEADGNILDEVEKWEEEDENEEQEDGDYDTQSPDLDNPDEWEEVKEL